MKFLPMQHLHRRDNDVEGRVALAFFAQADPCWMPRVCSVMYWRAMLAGTASRVDFKRFKQTITKVGVTSFC